MPCEVQSRKMLDLSLSLSLFSSNFSHLRLKVSAELKMQFYVHYEIPASQLFMDRRLIMNTHFLFLIVFISPSFIKV